MMSGTSFRPVTSVHYSVTQIIATPSKLVDLSYFLFLLLLLLLTFFYLQQQNDDADEANYTPGSCIALS